MRDEAHVLLATDMAVASSVWEEMTEDMESVNASK